MQYIVVCATYNQDAGMYVDAAKPFDNANDAAKFIVDDWHDTLVKVFNEKPLDFDAIKQKVEAMKPGETKCWKSDESYGIDEYHWKVFAH